MSEWISTSDGLPEVVENCIGWMPDDDNVDIVMLLPQGRWLAPEKVTHWMEIPPLDEWKEMEKEKPKGLGWYLTVEKYFEDPVIPLKLIWTGKEFITWSGVDVWSFNDRPITYWMPLPEPPYDEEEDDDNI